jgi:hypothetical protein
MLMTLAILLVIAITAGTLWLHGFWSNIVTLINLILAMLLATNFFEPVAALADSFIPAATYFWDVVSLWILFLIFFGAFRGITDMLSGMQVKFMMPIEMVGRTLIALWCGWLMACFVTFSLQMAPLNSETPLGAWQSPKDGSFLGFAPDRMWLGFMQQSSRGSLARGHYSGDQHPNDTSLDVQAFDPFGEFPYKYAFRRKKYAALEGMTP